LKIYTTILARSNFSYFSLLFHQVQDAIKRRLDKSNTGFSSNTNSTPAASQNARVLAINPPAKKGMFSSSVKVSNLVKYEAFYFKKVRGKGRLACHIKFGS